jgi:ubiquinone/menaquinone biosynthesis C-methylase UbiE
LDWTSWNRLRYTLWSPGYDLFAGFHRQRRRSIELLALQPGERVLIVGAGTGLDLPHLPEGVSVLATDLTPAMLAKAKKRARPGVELRVMDGQTLELPDESFDAVVLHLILAVIPDPVACLREAARVVRTGGRLGIFDKFLPEAGQPSVLRRAANVVTTILFSDINRKIGNLVTASGAPLVMEHDEPALLGNTFRILLLRKR